MYIYNESLNVHELDIFQFQCSKLSNLKEQIFGYEFDYIGINTVGNHVLVALFLLLNNIS